MRDIYVAAPFFTRRELQIVEQIENLCYAARHCLFSPRKASEAEQNDVNTNAKAIYRRNLEGLSECSEIIAWIDREQDDEYHKVYMCDTSDTFLPAESGPEYLRTLKGPLEQPDLGTVWEMGWGAATGKLVVAFTLRPRGGRLNLMLTQSCRHVIHGWEELREYLAASDPIAFCSAWAGEHE